MPITLTDVERARVITAPHLHRTPMLTSRTLGERIGATAYLKAELFQRTGSFKPRGAVFALASLPEKQRAKGIVTMSAGNAAAAIAYAAKATGAKVTVAMPESAPKLKVDATRGYGAEIRFAKDMTGLRELVGKLQDESGAYFLHPYDDDAMIAGHGSSALEILEDVPDADLIVVGIGGGGLISGVAVAAAAKRKGIRIVGVEPEGAPTMRTALDAGKPVALTAIKTIADGLAGPIAGTRGFDICQRLVEDVVLVSDEQIVEGMRFLAERAKLVAEPAGAAATAALLAGKIRVRPGERVVSIVSGGNVDRARFAELIAA
ncbi:MAG: pyridoxal-phosphate dependent enzyme [Chloroflexi bacterium]|nr:MAG: pyridoxal-phosphate dependent enzyme [Chloroflexota bacterium]TMC33394.1 MAG: pyridoxal-phosphate dependent enzyme [Chloroflexota bacterium]TMC56104.1 MAG: pyridoxal-phosphate dependent enzyme [Chloroflexota bacterium]